MTDKLAALRARREALVARAEAQRVGLKQDVEPLRGPLARVDQALAVIGYVKRHPSLMVGAGVILVIMRGSPAGKWLARGWLVWRAVQGLHSALASTDHSVSQRITGPADPLQPSPNTRPQSVTVHR